MKAGPELDLRVAREVMGFTEDTSGRKCAQSNPDMPCVVRDRDGACEWDMWRDFSPSTRIEHAWEVVEKMRLTWDFDLGTMENGWLCTFGRAGTPGMAGPVVDAHAQTAPLAVCLAALAVKGVEK